MSSGQKICKNEKCQKVLPEGYRYRYCEACRGKYGQAIKRVGEGVLAVAGSVLLVIVGKKK